MDLDLDQIVAPTQSIFQSPRHQPHPGSGYVSQADDGDGDRRQSRRRPSFLSIGLDTPLPVACLTYPRVILSLSLLLSTNDAWAFRYSVLVPKLPLNTLPRGLKIGKMMIP